MYQTFLMLTFIGHVLADYYFQTTTLAREKQLSLKKLLIHCLIYYVTMAAVFLPVFSIALLKWAGVISIFHLLIDGVKFLIQTRMRINKNRETVLYLTDQLLHILVILSVSALLVIKEVPVRYLPGIDTIVNNLNVNMPVLLSWLLILLILVQPCSVTIKKVLNQYRPNSEDFEDEGIPNAGALIGIFERLIILLMLYAGQFTAIGFVLTAKSIARYNKISENPQFAEYYLLGTLLSSLLIIVSYFFVF